MEEKKSRHHYVWQFYLRAWTIDDRIWCQHDGKRFTNSTRNVVVERDFYRLRELSADDVAIIQGIINQATAELRRLNQVWLDSFNALFAAKKINEAQGGNRPEVEQEIEVALNNLDENLHASIEGRTIPHLTALRKGDMSWMDRIEDFSSFAHFLCVQTFRGPGMRTRMQAAFEKLRGREMDSGVLCHVFATNVGASLVARRRSLRMTLLRAPAAAEFITGDQPVINTRALDRSGTVVPTEVEFFYPVSPRFALLISMDHASPGRFRELLRASDVTRYNAMIAVMAQQQLYATSEEALKSAASIVAPEQFK